MILVDRSFTSMSFDSFYWVPVLRHLAALLDQAPAYRELREWLQVLQWQDPGRAGRALGAEVPAPPHRGRDGARHVPRLRDRDDPPLAGRAPCRPTPRWSSSMSRAVQRRRSTRWPSGRYWSQRFRRVAARLRRGSPVPPRPLRRRRLPAAADRPARRGPPGARRARRARGPRTTTRRSRPTSSANRRGAARRPPLHRRRLRPDPRPARARLLASTRRPTCDPARRGRGHHRRRPGAGREAGRPGRRRGRQGGDGGPLHRRDGPGGAGGRGRGRRRRSGSPATCARQEDATRVVGHRASSGSARSPGWSTPPSAHPGFHDLRGHPGQGRCGARWTSSCTARSAMTRAVVPHMKAAGRGSIVNVGTMATRKPRPRRGRATRWPRRRWPARPSTSRSSWASTGSGSTRPPWAGWTGRACGSTCR